MLGSESHAIQPAARHCTNYTKKCKKKHVAPHQYGSRHTTCTGHVLYAIHHTASVTDILSHTKPATSWSLLVCISLLFSLPYIRNCLRVLTSGLYAVLTHTYLNYNLTMMSTHNEITAISEFLQCMWTVDKCVPHKFEPEHPGHNCLQNAPQN
jgi:DNA integrity scanning protein DisA with diadenylate cyclase activity